MKFLFKFIFLFFIPLLFHAQQVREKVPSYFGIQYKPLLPGDFLSKSIIDVQDGTLSGKFTQLTGYSFGAMTRVNMTKLLNLEIGINQIKRNYKVNFAIPDSTLEGESKLGIVSYDIPLNLLVYIQLAKKIFTNVSLGTSLTFFPSNVASKIVIDDHIFIAEGRKNRHFGGTINANLGFEFRSKKAGFYYIGASAIIPYSSIYTVAAGYVYGNVTQNIGIGYINGSYLSLDLRYFFPNIAKKGIQLEQGPIKQ